MTDSRTSPLHPSIPPQLHSYNFIVVNSCNEFLKLVINKWKSSYLTFHHAHRQFLDSRGYDITLSKRRFSAKLYQPHYMNMYGIENLVDVLSLLFVFLKVGDSYSRHVTVDGCCAAALQQYVVILMVH